MQICLILTGILAVLGSIFFGCGIGFSILSAILCFGTVIADFVLKYIFKKNISSLLRIGIMAAVLILSGALLLQNGIRTQTHGIYDYNERTEQLYQYIAEEEYDEAMDIIETMEEDYGESGYTCAFRTLELIGEKNYEAALEMAESMTDKKSRLYYLLELAIYMGLDEEENDQEFGALVEEAANKYPSWTIMQQLTGIAKLHDDNYVGAAYYLSRAYEQDKTDLDTLYYLGVAHYKNGDYEDAVRFFGEAVECGADNQMSGEILWYLNRLP